MDLQSGRAARQLRRIDADVVVQQQAHIGLENLSNLAGAATPSPAGNSFARATNANIYQTDSKQDLVAMAAAAVSPAGGGAPHNNMMPYLALNFCIALQGIYPPRT